MQHSQSISETLSFHDCLVLMTVPLNVVLLQGACSTPADDVSCTPSSKALDRNHASSMGELPLQRGACVPVPASPACSSSASICGPAAACTADGAQADPLRQIQTNSLWSTSDGPCGVQQGPSQQLACGSSSHAVSSTSSKHCSSTCVSGASTAACKGLQSDRPRWRR
jgi:hypothetical protein